MKTYILSGPSGITATIFKYNSADVYETSVYRVSVDVENGLYSKAYNQYASNISYSLIIPTKRRLLFGDVKELISTTWVVFKDSCNGVAYLVSFGEDTFVALNNKFKSSLEFNIATR